MKHLKILFLLIGIQVFAQSEQATDSERDMLYATRTNNLIALDTLLDSKENVFIWYFAKARWSFLKYARIKEELIAEMKLEYEKNENNAFSDLYYLTQADFLINKNGVNDSLAFSNYEKVLQKAIARKNYFLTCEALKRILDVLSRNGEQRNLLKKYTERYMMDAYDTNEEAYSLYYSMSYDMLTKEREDTGVEIQNGTFLKAVLKARAVKNRLLEAKIFQLLGVKYWGFNKDYDLATKNYDKAAEIYESLDNAYAHVKIFGILVNKAAIAIRKNKPEEALDNLYKAKPMRLPAQHKKDYVLLYDYLSKAHIYLRQKDSAMYYLARKQLMVDSVNTLQQAKTISTVEARFGAKEKEKENLQLKKEKQNLIIGAIILLVFIGFIGLLIYKNTAKKRVLAEQEVLLKQQKVSTLLKEQELMSIDAMIEGQEKERQRVANELHDDLGSKMATIKLHLENVKVQKEDSSLKHASNLLEEAYQKIRGISHVKNSGVIAKQGLLPALQRMVYTISETNQIDLTVDDFGLENRMENSLELNIFRMIQELVTNIIKHAGATKGSIQLTQHEDSLNILIEDNGKGFDTTKIQILDNGIGLRNIEKRIEHLEGRFTIDSVLGKGTSIIIDIPI